ncbi:MAG TPA: methylmalonyl-CoA mutase family protein, partial [Acidimicrobiales bacterium]|nr:methylmalonyl-CoA mutase family protein [Acidimicrobiales bacterium]
TWTRGHYGASDPRSSQLRFHTQTAGVSLTAQQPEVNVARTAIEALAGVLGGTQSLHTNSMDEAIALPTAKAARVALRTQQVIAYETNVAHVADPLGGSYYVEELTSEVERQAGEILAEILDKGDGSMLEGCIAGIEENWFQGRIADSAYALEKSFNDGRRIVVGVNAFTEGNEDDDLAILRITNADEKKQVERLAGVRASRDATRVELALATLKKEAADPTINLMPALIEAAKAQATVGEMMGAMVTVFGRHVEVPSL